jgi:hypothetical protein
MNTTKGRRLGGYSISLTQFCEAADSVPDSGSLRGGIGLARSTVKEGLKALVDRHGLIRRTHGLGMAADFYQIVSPPPVADTRVVAATPIADESDSGPNSSSVDTSAGSEFSPAVTSPVGQISAHSRVRIQPAAGSNFIPTERTKERTRKTNTPKPPSSPLRGEGHRDPPAAFGLIPDGPQSPVLPMEPALPKDGWFEEFWSMYWRKDGRERAKKLFDRKVRTEAEWERVQAAVKEQTPEMLSREKQYRPHASTWLNQDRMLDVPEESPAQVRPRSIDTNMQRRLETNKLARMFTQIQQSGKAS